MGDAVSRTDDPTSPRSTARRARPTCASRWPSTAPGRGTRSTGVGFLDHMLDLLARHGRLDLDVAVRGDLETGAHHTVEDTGIVLGQALDRALGDRAGITRYGARRRADGRGARVVRDRHLRAPVPGPSTPTCRRGSPAASTTSSTEEFFRAVANARAHDDCTSTVEAGTNAHHMIEAASRPSPARCARRSRIDPTETGVPSTKGTLTA